MRPTSPTATRLAPIFARSSGSRFEMPVLYFALVPLLLVTGLATLTQVTLAWVYVAPRAGHSLAHIAGRIRLRFVLFLVSNAVLGAMWIGFAVDIGFSAR